MKTKLALIALLVATLSLGLFANQATANRSADSCCACCEAGCYCCDTGVCTCAECACVCGCCGVDDCCQASAPAVKAEAKCCDCCEAGSACCVTGACNCCSQPVQKTACCDAVPAAKSVKQKCCK